MLQHHRPVRTLMNKSGMSPTWKHRFTRFASLANTAPIERRAHLHKQRIPTGFRLSQVSTF